MIFTKLIINGGKKHYSQSIQYSITRGRNAAQSDKKLSKRYFDVFKYANTEDSFGVTSHKHQLFEKVQVSKAPSPRKIMKKNKKRTDSKIRIKVFV